jgi:hypothetical protein
MPSYRRRYWWVLLPQPAIPTVARPASATALLSVLTFARRAPSGASGTAICQAPETFGPEHAAIKSLTLLSVELPNQRRRDRLHVFRFVVESTGWPTVYRELKIRAKRIVLIALLDATKTIHFDLEISVSDLRARDKVFARDA